MRVAAILAVIACLGVVIGAPLPTYDDISPEEIVKTQPNDFALPGREAHPFWAQSPGDAYYNPKLLKELPVSGVDPKMLGHFAVLVAISNLNASGKVTLANIADFLSKVKVGHFDTVGIAKDGVNKGVANGMIAKVKGSYQLTAKGRLVCEMEAKKLGYGLKASKAAAHKTQNFKAHTAKQLKDAVLKKEKAKEAAFAIKAAAQAASQAATKKQVADLLGRPPAAVKEVPKGQVLDLSGQAKKTTGQALQPKDSESLVPYAKQMLPKGMTSAQARVIARHAKHIAHHQEKLAEDHIHHIHEHKSKTDAAFKVAAKELVEQMKYTDTHH